MKKLLLFSVLAASVCVSTQAQTRLSLYEEFTGENCPPCAATNPRFWALCLSGTNPTKMLQISYMAPIPSAGPFYNQNKIATDARISYYSVPFAPYGRIDGAVSSPGRGSSAGNPGYFTQGELDSAAAIPSPFNVTVSSVWNSTYDSIVSTVTVSCVASYSASSLKLRAALVQNVYWDVAPGSNGETDFKDVVRAMYPNAAGTTMTTTSWTSGMSQTFTVAGAVPSFVDKSQSPYMVFWIQNDGTKAIAQAAKSAILTIPTDMAAKAVPSTACVPGTSGSITPVVTLKNTATTVLTSATIYYSIDGGTMSTFNWTGSLAAGAQISVNLPATTLTAGTHTIYDSIGTINGGADVNKVNNAARTVILVQSTAMNSLPISNTFEGTALPANWSYFDENGNTKNWTTATVVGRTGSSTKAAKFDGYNFSEGEENMVIFPCLDLTRQAANASFWVAYAMYTSAYLDSLELLQSWDCGATWSTIWAKGGADLSTTAASTSAFAPTAASQWKQFGTYIPRQPAGGLIAFRGISQFGNSFYLDDINLTSVPVSVGNVNSTSKGSMISPNPTSGNTNLTFSLPSASEVSVAVVAADGRQVWSATKNCSAGENAFSIETSNLAPGIYRVIVATAFGRETQTLSVVK
jgi:hypothetical protein